MGKIQLKRTVGLNRVLLASVAMSLFFVLTFSLYLTTLYYPTPTPIKLNKGFNEINSNRDPVHIQARKLEKRSTFPCTELRPPLSFLGQRGSFRVLYNYVMPTLRFTYDESVTYTTHGDHTYLDNLVPLVERWLGPVSVSVYSPGTDYYETLLRIQYLRECTPLVKDFVSFHLYFGVTQIPQNLRSTGAEALSQMPQVNCSMGPTFGPNVATFRKSRKLLYPVNVGRNIARKMASTHYVLASDIELYPSPNLIPGFLEMIKRDGRQFMKNPNPKVFVLPMIELSSTVSALPYDKVELQKMLKETVAIPFRVHVCPKCFSIPKLEEWNTAEVTEGLHVFTVGKRHVKQWEPTFIGTKSDPMYDERLTWEGAGDRVLQGYILCLLDYEFHILDNAFLVHRPGIKKHGRNIQSNVIRKQREMIKKTIKPEFNLLYGRRPECLII